MLTEKELGLLEWDSATLDMSFMDDYPNEVTAILEAQLAKALKGKEAEIEQARKDERERALQILRKPLMYFKTSGTNITSHFVDEEAIIALGQALREGE